jgi:hypothetical protein
MNKTRYSTNAREIAHRGGAATNAPSPPPATLSNDPLKALYTAPVPRAGLSERAPPSHLSGKSWPAQPYTLFGKMKSLYGHAYLLETQGLFTQG